MKFPLYIAMRYLFARKSHQAINIMSLISLLGVTLASMALVTVLSVFNGFEDLISSLYSVFDPDLKVTLQEGKVFQADSIWLAWLRQDPEIQDVSLTLEENVLVEYGDLQAIAMMKGVDRHYAGMTGIDSLMYFGTYGLYDSLGQASVRAVLGFTVASTLQMGYRQLLPMNVYMLRRDAPLAFDLERAVKQAQLHPTGIYTIEEESDGYVLVPLEFMQDLLESGNALTAVDIRLTRGADAKAVRQRVAAWVGPDFKVQTRYQQKELVYKIMKYEKWAGFMILAFILLIASFNVISSLAMLMIEKKEDAQVLSAMGADESLIRRIFYVEGMLISFSGAVLGLSAGAAVCWIQQQYGVIKLANAGSFIIDSYPVRMQTGDFVWILAAVALIGIVTCYFPARHFFTGITDVQAASSSEDAARYDTL